MAGSKKTTLGVHVKVQFDNQKIVQANLNKLIKKLEKNSKINLKINTKSIESDLNRITRSMDNLNNAINQNVNNEINQNIRVTQTDQALPRVQESDDENVIPTEEKMSKIGFIAENATSMINMLNVVMDDSLTNMEKWSIGLDGVGDALLESGNIYAMAGGVVVKITGAIIDNINKAEKEQQNLIDNSGAMIDKLKGQIETLNGMGEDYERLASTALEFGIDSLSTEDQERLYEIMDKIIKINPKLVTGVDDYGRKISDLSVPIKDIMNILNGDLDTQKGYFNKNETKDITDQTTAVNKLNDSLKENKGRKQDYENALKEPPNEMLEYPVIQRNELGTERGYFYLTKDQIKSEINDLQKETELKQSELKNAQKELDRFKGEKDVFNQITKKVPDGIGDLVHGFEDAKKKLSETTNEAQKLKGYIDEVDSNGKLSMSTTMEALDEHPELIGYLNDEIKLKNKLKELSDEAEQNQKKYFKDMVLNSESCLSDILEENEDFFSKLEDKYGVDLEKADSLARAKYIIQEEYKAKIDNLYKSSEDKEEIKKRLSNYKVNLLDLGNNQTEGSFNPILTGDAALKKILLEYNRDNAVAEIDEKGEKKSEKIWGKFTNKNKTGAVKYIDKLKPRRDMVDEFSDIDSKLEQNTFAQNELQEILDISPKSSQDTAKYLQEENKLLEERQGILHESADKYRGIMKDSKITIQSQGVEFIGENVDFESYADKVYNLEKQIRTAEGESKSKLSDDLNILKGAFQDYSDAQTKDIPKLQEEWRKLSTEIKKNQFAENDLKLAEFDNALDDINKELTNLGEIDSMEKVAEKTRLYHKEQNVLNGKLEETRKLADEYRKKLDSLGEETDANRLEMALLREQLEKLDNTDTEIQISISQNREEMKQEMVDSIKEIEDAIIEVIEQGIEDEKKEREKAHQDTLDDLDEEKEKWQEVYDTRLKALSDEKNEIDHKDTMNDLFDEKNEIQQELNKLSLDDSLESKVKQKELSEELSELEKQIAKENRDYEYEQLEAEIQEEQQLKMDSIDTLVEEENNKFKKDMENLENRKTQEALYEEAHRIMMTQSYDQISEMIATHEKTWGEGFSAVGDIIMKEMVSPLQLALKLMKEVNYDKDNNRYIGKDIEENVDEIAKDSSERPDTLSSISIEDYTDYVNNKLAYILGDAETKKVVKELNERIRGDKITNDTFSYLDLINWGKDDSEKLTQSQLNNSINIKSLVEVHGDVNDGNIDEIQKRVEDALYDVIKTSNLNGIHRRL